ncbi:TPA: hypothetical protein ACGZ9U_001936 [Elizabethkingia anophelis]
MKKTLLSTSLWVILALSTLTSCRTEDVANTQKQVEDKRFAVFIPKSEGEKIDYVQGFAYLYQNYFKENSIKEKDQKLVAKDFGVVDFRIHSQLFIQEDGTKAMVFPLRKENSINGLIMAILENNDTSLRYTVLEESQKGYTEILQRFLAVDRENDRPIHIPSSGKFPPGSSPVALAPPIKTHGISINDNGNGDIDREGDGGSSGPVKEIREVTITVPKVPSPPIVPPPLPQDIKLPPVGPGGGCEMYENCPPYRGGGGGSNNNGTPQQDPCSQAKAVTSKENVKKAIEELTTKMNDLQKKKDNEQLYVLGKDGSTKIIEGGQSHVIFSPDIYTQGSVHDHDSKGYPMFPPHDINSFISTVRVQNYPQNPNDTRDKSGEAFLGIVTPDGNYFMTFNGTKDDIPPMYGAGVVNKYQEDFGSEIFDLKIHNVKITDEVLQKKFFEYLDKMGLSGKVNLIKQIKGNNYPITRNSDGTINNNSTNPCKN